MATNILWCGGEDVDFPLATPVTSTGAGYRTSYSRAGLFCNGINTTASRGPSFSGGAVTSCWLHAQLAPSLTFSGQHHIGLSLNSAANGAGLYLGSDFGGSNAKLSLYKYDGVTTWTQLAAETGATLVSSVVAVDMQVISYGATATVNVYYSGNLLFTFSGNVVSGGLGNLDCVSIPGNGGFQNTVSEIIVADGDTRALSLCTLAPNAAGDSSGSWTNTYTSINPININDGNAIYDNNTGSDFQCNLTDLPGGSFSVLAVKAVARAEVTVGATPTGFKLGIKSGGVINVDGGHSPGATFVDYERLMNATNPATAGVWSQSDINPLQLDFQSM
jgi:hypothetical protein